MPMVLERGVWYYSCNLLAGASRQCAVARTSLWCSARMQRSAPAAEILSEAEPSQRSKGYWWKRLRVERIIDTARRQSPVLKVCRPTSLLCGLNNLASRYVVCCSRRIVQLGTRPCNQICNRMPEEWAILRQPYPIAPELVAQECQLTKAGRSVLKAGWQCIRPSPREVTWTSGSFSAGFEHGKFGLTICLC